MTWSKFLSLPLLLLLWFVVAAGVSNRLFPDPTQVAIRLFAASVHGDLLWDLGWTSIRAFAAFFVAMLVGTLLGSLLGRFVRADNLFQPWVLVALNLPAIVVAIMFYIWLGLTEIALILAVAVNKLPLVAVTMREGARNLSSEYRELALAFRISLWRYARFVAFPQLTPYLLTAARTGFSLIWKIVLVFEILGSDRGIGFRISIYFQNFDVTGILAYTVAFMTVAMALEFLGLRRLEKKVLGWRNAGN